MDRPRLKRSACGDPGDDAAADSENDEASEKDGAAADDDDNPDNDGDKDNTADDRVDTPVGKNGADPCFRPPPHPFSTCDANTSRADAFRLIHTWHTHPPLGFLVPYFVLTVRRHTRHLPFGIEFKLHRLIIHESISTCQGVPLCTRVPVCAGKLRTVICKRERYFSLLNC